jgi:hypothetical protein
MRVARRDDWLDPQVLSDLNASNSIRYRIHNSAEPRFDLRRRYRRIAFGGFTQIGTEVPGTD